MPLAEVIHEIRLKNEKWKISENVYFFDEKYFSNDFEKTQIFKKSLFQKMWKIKNVDFFEKSWLFEIFDFSSFSKKWLFENVFFSKSFEKYFSSKK